MTDPANLSALTAFADVVADATRRFRAGEIDTHEYKLVLQRQGFTTPQAEAEAADVLRRSMGSNQ